MGGWGLPPSHHQGMTLKTLLPSWGLDFLPTGRRTWGQRPGPQHRARGCWHPRGGAWDSRAAEEQRHRVSDGPSRKV